VQTILQQIIETKRLEVAKAKLKCPMDELQALIVDTGATRDFFQAVTKNSGDGVCLIAEVKAKSPSAGLLMPDYQPAAIAQTYATHGASAISVLTDETYFGGHIDHIKQVKASVTLPVLRKEFIVDEYQIYESRAAGADAILLIAGVPSTNEMAAWVPITRELGMTALVEVHDNSQLQSVLKTLGPPGQDAYLLGINNRDLAIQKTNLANTENLAAMLPEDSAFVSESGIHTRDDVLRILKAGASAMLVGESLLRSENLGEKIRVLLEK